MGAVDVAVGHVGSAGAQRGGRSVERLRGRSAEVGAGVQHSERELDAGIARRDAPDGAGDGVSSVECQTDRRDNRRQCGGRCRRPQRAGERRARSNVTGEVVAPCGDVVAAKMGTPPEADTL